MFFNIDQDNYCESDYSSEEYGEWYRYNDYISNYAKIASKHGDVGLFPEEAEPKVGDYIYLVRVTYSDGDSFGNSTGNQVMLWAFTDKDKAEELRELIKLDNETSPEFDHSFKPLMFYGVPISTNDWKGYFERFEECHVEKLEVKRK